MTLQFDRYNKYDIMKPKRSPQQQDWNNALMKWLAKEKALQQQALKAAETHYYQSPFQKMIQEKKRKEAFEKAAKFFIPIQKKTQPSDGGKRRLVFYGPKYGYYPFNVKKK